MATLTALDIQSDRRGDIRAIMARLGSAGHPHVQSLLLPQVLLHDLTDAVHAVCAVHGNHPCMIDYAMARGIELDTLPWLIGSSNAFSHERAFLAHLTSAAGPLPSTPGQAQTDAALTQLRQTLEMLANSDGGAAPRGGVRADPRLALDPPDPVAGGNALRRVHAPQHAARAVARLRGRRIGHRPGPRPGFRCDPVAGSAPRSVGPSRSPSERPARLGCDPRARPPPVAPPTHSISLPSR